MWPWIRPGGTCQNDGVAELERAGSDVRRFDSAAVAARGSVQQRARFVEQMTPWLRRWARRYQGRGVDSDDLLQDAVLGLLRAIERFDPDRGPFLLWARLWVRQALQQALAESSRAFRLPTHVLWEMHEAEGGAPTALDPPWPGRATR